ncbi:Decaprenyl-diphosphate synthase subunit 2 [Eumeta japonica]|uniref:Decaprenyl-diphosphate synthase subunit 2 n=1 Tax=Eumeta variegata TaxID=151549 RepID=A0A4C1YX45_EUMVA|nr:Decaprenyl-diphosphate synthase subunit 2 [Eumeta japonica]
MVLNPPHRHWDEIIREAESIVGYPTSFMNLRWLLSDEFANMALYLRKLVGSNHPILQTAKNVLYNEHNNFQPWGLAILLLSESIKKPQSNSILDNTVVENQRKLAELIEMIRTGHFIHKGILNAPTDDRTDKTESALFGNKLAILIGDYLLVTAYGMLAKIRNHDLSYMVCAALRDMSEGQFYGARDEQNMPLPGLTNERTIIEDVFEITVDTLSIDTKDTLGYPVREWTVRGMFNGASLLGRGCQGAMLLGKQKLEMQEQAYRFGSHLFLAWQAASDLQKTTLDNKEPFCLVSAPVLFALDRKKDLCTILEQAKNGLGAIDSDKLKVQILKTDAVQRTRMLYEEHSIKANDCLKIFGKGKSIDTIKRHATFRDEPGNVCRTSLYISNYDPPTVPHA